MTASSFFVPQMLTAPIYGLVSDKCGRKPILVFGLIGSAIFIAVFGTSHSLLMAVASRFLCGLFNGN